MALRAVFGSNNGLAPTEGPMALTVKPDFSSAATVQLSFEEEINGGHISWLQSVYIDNADGDDPVILQMVGYTEQRIVCQPGTQQHFPIIGNGTAFTVTAAVDATPVLIFQNVPVAAVVSAPGITDLPVPLPVDIVSSIVIRVSAQTFVPTDLTSHADVTLTAGVATVIAVADGDRETIYITSLPSNDAAGIRLGDSLVTAARGVVIYPGQSATIPTTDALYGFSAVAGQVVTYTSAGF